MPNAVNEDHDSPINHAMQDPHQYGDHVITAQSMIFDLKRKLEAIKLDDYSNAMKAFMARMLDSLSLAAAMLDNRSTDRLALHITIGIVAEMRSVNHVGIANYCESIHKECRDALFCINLV